MAATRDNPETTALSEALNSNDALFSGPQYARHRSSISKVFDEPVSKETPILTSAASQRGVTYADRLRYILQSPVASAVLRSLQFVVPLVITVTICTVLVALVVLTSRAPVPVPNSILRMEYQDNANDSKITTAVFTVVATILASLLGFSYAASIRIVIRKRVVSRSHQLRTLAAWLDLATHSLNLFKGGVFWLALTVLSMLLLGIQTTSINTLITPVQVTSLSDETFLDLDLTDPALIQFITNGSVSLSKCNWWSDYGACVISNYLPNFLDAGRAAMPQTTSSSYTWFPAFQFWGSTGGVLPLTLGDLEGYILTGDPAWNPRAALDYSWYQMNLQGITATVSCTNSSTSPLSFEVTSTAGAVGQVNSTCSCGAAEPVPLLVGQNWAQAAVCPSSNDGSGEWSFYLRHHGEYIMNGVENITCTMTPYLTMTNCTTYSSGDTYVIYSADPISAPDDSIFAPILTLLPQAVNIAQSPQNNLAVQHAIATASMQPGDFLTDEYDADIDPLLVQGYVTAWEAYLQGWVEYLGTAVKIQYQQGLQDGYTLVPSGPGLRSTTGQFFIQVLYVWSFSASSVGFLMPIVVVTLVTLGLLFWGLVDHRATELAKFDPTDPISLILAGASCDHGLRREFAEARGDRDDLLANRKVRQVRVALRDGELMQARQ